MSPPKVPLPPRPHKPEDEAARRARFDTFDEGMRRASSIPPAIKRHTTDRDIKVQSDMQAAANAITAFQIASNRQHEQLVAQVAALHAHFITFHAWATRNPWLRSPVTRLLATFFGSALGAYAAMKGLQ